MQAKISKISASYPESLKSLGFAGPVLASSRVNPLPQVLRKPRGCRYSCGSGHAREEASTGKQAKKSPADAGLMVKQISQRRFRRLPPWQ
jgi:hypothetical protein